MLLIISSEEGFRVLKVDTYIIIVITNILLHFIVL